MLRQAKLLKGCGIYITEDVSSKGGVGKGKARVAPTEYSTSGEDTNKEVGNRSLEYSESLSLISGMGYQFKCQWDRSLKTKYISIIRMKNNQLM